MPRILLVDDEAAILKALRRELHRSEWEVTTCTSPKAALELLKGDQFDVIMSDYRMQEMNGVDFLVRARLVQPSAIRLVLSGFADMEAVVDAINEAHIFKFLVKPWQSKHLRDTLSLAWERRQQVLAHEAMLAAGREADSGAEWGENKAAVGGMSSVPRFPTGTIVLSKTLRRHTDTPEKGDA